MRKKILVGICCVSLLLAGCGASEKSSSSSNSTADSSKMDASHIESYEFGEDTSDESYHVESKNDMTTDDSTSTETVKATDDAIQVTDEDVDLINVTNQTTKKSSDIQYERKLIRTANVELETDHFDRVRNDVDLLVKQQNGYIGNSYLENEGYRRCYSIEARIPQESFDDFLKSVGKIGTVTVKNLQQTAQDITLDYYDSAQAKKALEMERDRISEMIEEATSLKDIITLEDKLSELEERIMSYDREIRNYDNKVDYSTVNLCVSEVLEPTLDEKEPAWTRMSSGFVRSIQKVWHGFVNLIIFVVVNSPYLVILAIFGMIIMKMSKRHKKSKGNKENKENKIESIHDKK